MDVDNVEKKLESVELTNGGNEKDGVANDKDAVEKSDIKDVNDDADNDEIAKESASLNGLESTKSEPVQPKDVEAKEVGAKEDGAKELEQKESEPKLSDKDTKEKHKKKSVGFAPPPEELKQHHEHLHELEEEKKKASIFHKIPPELQYLEKKHHPDHPPPKPLPTYKDTANKPKPKVLGDLKKVHVKDISVINKNTELNFNYPTIELPIPAHNVLVSIKYASLNSCDISKLNKYYYNFSDTQVGLGYEFVGVIVDIGSNVKDFSFAKGDHVIGCVSASGRKGSLSSTLLLNPNKDLMLSVDEITMDKLAQLNPYFDYEKVVDSDDEEEHNEQKANEHKNEEEHKDHKKKRTQYLVDSTLPSLAKGCIYPVLYFKAQQALQHLKEDRLPNILINGADTNLGYTLLHILNSSAYAFERLNLVLIVQEKNLKDMKLIVNHFKTNKYATNCEKNFEIVVFDLRNEDLVLPGEKVPIHYKKPDLLAIEILEAMFRNSRESINADNINHYKLDMIIDIIGSNTLTKTSIKYKKFDYLSFPVFENLQSNIKLSQLLQADVKEQFLVKILKPKQTSSSYVSFCKFGLKQPSYSIDRLIDYSTQSNEQSLLNPWSLSWGAGLANSFLKYNYHDEINLVIKRQWLVEGLNMMLKNELKFKIDQFIDWRDNFRQHINHLRREDGKVVFQVEDF